MSDFTPAGTGQGSAAATAAAALKAAAAHPILAADQVMKLKQLKVAEPWQGGLEAGGKQVGTGGLEDLLHRSE